MVDIKINAWSPGFTKPQIRLIPNRYQRKKFKIQPISVPFKETKGGLHFLIDLFSSKVEKKLELKFN